MYFEDTIRLLHPSAFEMQYILVWLPEKSGSYSTKSGYALAKLQGNGQESEEALHHFNWKTCVWSIATSPKLKLFLWKLSHKALSVGDALVRRGINVTGECKRCGGRESEIHAFFQCPFAAKVWDLLPALHKPLASTASILQLLERGKRIINLPPSGVSQPLYPWILWNLWTSRNQLLFEDKNYSELKVLNKAIRDAREWSWAQPLSLQKPSTNIAPPPSICNDPYVLLCFTDGAWDAGSKKCGLGWAFKDKAGLLRAQGSGARGYVNSALMAEALALKTAISAAIHLGFLNLRCLSDSSSLISLLTTDFSVTEL